MNTLHCDKSATALKLNELGRVTLRTHVPLLLDEYTRNPATGSFILIDPDTNVTVAAGMVRDTVPRGHPGSHAQHGAPPLPGRRPADQGPHGVVHRAVRFGKSSVAVLAEQMLLSEGCLHSRRGQPASRPQRRPRLLDGRPR